MTKKSIFNKTLTLINCVWYASCLIIALELKDNFKLSFWVYICIAVPLIVVGEILIRKILKGEKIKWST